MTIEDRIRERRTALGISQEYLAEQLGVSRQAVSKWESGKSSPDTRNLIALAGLFGVSVQWLAVGEQPVTDSACALADIKCRRKKVAIILAVLLLSAAAVLLVIHLAPVDWDAGACGGGFGTWLFDKHSPHLTGVYGQTKEGYAFEALRGTQEVSWSGRTIVLSFDIRYKTQERGTVTDRVSFRGKRVWPEKYRWRIWTAEQETVKSEAES